MKYLSVCSGIEAATVAWRPIGWHALGFAEIDKFPASVLSHHYPEIPNHGDFTKIQEKNARGIDLLVGGTPCQSFSVAGLRGGMADDRGNLALEFLRLAQHARPNWVVWENVPGVLSSGGGRDFGTFLGGLAELGYGWAYRILDAQYFGVAQRRRRVFVVGYLGDWRRATAVLFERQSLSGDPAPSRKTGENVAATLTGGSDTGRNHGKRSGSDRDTLICNTVAHPLDTRGGERMSPDHDTLIAHTLRSEGFDASEDGTGRGTPIVSVLAIRGRGGESTLEHRADGTANALLTPNGGRCGMGVGAIHRGSVVRRLTPRECERLQGFPDNYTLVPTKRGMAADGSRYKALGNSMAVPVMRWIGDRIDLVRKSNEQ